MCRQIKQGLAFSVHNVGLIYVMRTGIYVYISYNVGLVYVMHALSCMYTYLIMWVWFM